MSPLHLYLDRRGHLKRSNLRQRHFQPALETAKITGLTIHGLRHR